MPKNMFQDMVRVKREREMNKPPQKPAPVEPKILRTPQKIEPRKILEEIPEEAPAGRHRYGIWFLAIVAIVFLFFAVSLLFVKAKVTVNPEVKEISLNEDFGAVKGSSALGVSFDLVVLAGAEEKTVAGGEERVVNESAKGKAIIYNNFSTATQVLDIDTRLEGSNSKLYKTEKRIVVPGMKDGKPGQIEVGIYAAEAGEDYNSPPLDFKIFGFKGGPKYEKFYGRSSSPISGGHSGMSREISLAQKEAAVEELKVALEKRLLEKASNQIPAGFILWPDAIFFEAGEEVVKAGEEEDTSLLELKGTLYGFLFEEEKISKEIIREAMPDHDGSVAYVANLKELNFSLLDRANITSGNVNSVKNINFNLTGKPQVVYELNSAALTTELLGKGKKDFEQILSQYPHVESADLSLRPVWKKTFPKDREDIEVVVNYP